MASSTNRQILAQETLKSSKKGKSTFNGYAARVTGNANNSISGKENLGKGKK